jgi:ATPase subunit of ABC transporter with duplicated ATPase domains
MKKLSLQLNQQYKSFESGSSYTFDGDLIILSGVNGTGKSQLLNTLFGFDRLTGQYVSSSKSIDGSEINFTDIDLRSFRENISIAEITASTSQSFLTTRDSAWASYANYRLDPQNGSNSQFQDSCVEAKRILLQRFDETTFNQGEIPQNQFYDCLKEASFVWKQGDKFTNAIEPVCSLL